jgi:hypothetical protein
VGEGSTFILWLPAAEPEPHEARAYETDGTEAAPPAHGLAQVGETLLRELPAVLETFVTRLRAECPVPGAAALKFYQLADHVGCYLADLGSVLIGLDQAQGQPSSVLGDATEIHRVVAMRHGAQRARLGWTAQALRCEFQILREEIERLVRQRGAATDAAVVDGALAVVGRLLGQAEWLSARTWARSHGQEASEQSSSERT